MEGARNPHGAMPGRRRPRRCRQGCEVLSDLLQGGTAAEFLAQRDVDALGTDPAGAYTRSVRACAAAFAARGAPDRVDERLDASLVAWISDHLDQIYAGLSETPVAADTTHRFFALPRGALADGASRQDRLLHLMGRRAEARSSQ
jgi:hypothetical protein